MVFVSDNRASHIFNVLLEICAFVNVQLFLLLCGKNMIDITSNS